VTEEELVAAILDQFGDMLLKVAEYGEGRGKDAKNPGKELYWAGYVEGLKSAAAMAKDRKLRK